MCSERWLCQNNPAPKKLACRLRIGIWLCSSHITPARKFVMSTSEGAGSYGPAIGEPCKRLDLRCGTKFQCNGVITVKEVTGLVSMSVLASVQE